MLVITQNWKLLLRGKNPEHALKRIKEAIEAFLEETKKMGTVEEVLRVAGSVKENKKWRLPFISISPWRKLAKVFELDDWKLSH